MRILQDHELLQVAGSDATITGGGFPGYIQINMPIHFVAGDNSGATSPENLASLIQMLNAQWSQTVGDLHITMNIYSDNGPGSDTAVIYAGAVPNQQTADGYVGNNGHSFTVTFPDAPDVTFWSLADLNGPMKGPEAIAHEIGHMLGLSDTVVDANGHVTFNAQGLMGNDPNDTAILQSHLDAILSGGDPNMQYKHQLGNLPDGFLWNNSNDSWWDPLSGQYYSLDYNSGYYYNSYENWWYDPSSGYYYDGSAGAWYDIYSDSYYMESWGTWISSDYYWFLRSWGC